MALKSALNFFAVLSLHLRFGIVTCILSNGSDLSSNVEDSQAKLTLDVHELLDVPLPENCLSHDPPSAFNFSDR